MAFEIVNADVMDWAASYEGEPFHALLCDAPYEMREVNIAKLDEQGKGFMGKEWDGSGVSFNPDTWRALAQHLHPGAFLFVFAGTINDDLISVAMRKAGLRKHHKVLNYSYGSGFPKSTRINRNDNGHDEWAGHRYGLQALKPAAETILVFQKPYESKPVDSITETGAGALNIDKSRIGIESADPNHRKPSNTNWGSSDSDVCYGAGLSGRPIENLQPSGRWPANLTLTHHPECVQVGTRRVKSNERKRKGIAGRSKFDGKYNSGERYDNVTDQINPGPNDSETVDAWDCHELCAVRAMGEMSGESKGGSSIRHNRKNPYGSNRTWSVSKTPAQDTVGYIDKGTAARFFYNASWTYEQLEQSAPVFYTAKSSRRERDMGLEGRNTHPTVKSISLTKWLATLLLPPDAYAPRRLLVPFSGSGSEMIGAILAGWEEIVGVELMQEYVEISEDRCRFWQTMMIETDSSDPRAILKTHGKRSKAEQDIEKKTQQIEMDLCVSSS